MPAAIDSLIDREVIALGRVRVVRRGDFEGLAAMPTPLLAALRRAGTRHLYGDTADVDELAPLISPDGSRVRSEIDGNTANQPLVRKVLGRYLANGGSAGWTRHLRAIDPALRGDSLLPLLYAVLCGRIASDMAGAYAVGRPWESSLQLHMSLGADPAAARRVGRLLHRMVPGGLVKVPFAPDAPECLVVARDLEREGIAVNLTSTFSARQVVVAALLCDVTRTNIFLGRLNQGLRAELLGEHVVLEAQRALLRLRREDGVRTELIAASMRDWQSFVRLAGCDAFTAPCKVYEELLAQPDVRPEAISSRLRESHADRLGIAPEVDEKLGLQRIAALYRVEPQFVQFLHELREHPDDGAFRDGDALFKCFDESGFGDFFHAPSAAERAELALDKLPQLDGRLLGRIPLDTHFSLLANADFAKTQREIDAQLERPPEA